MTKLYVFQCNGNDKIIGFALENTGKSLPLKYCGNGWVFLKEINISRESPALMGASANDILNGIEMNGYHITGAEMSFTERSI